MQSILSRVSTAISLGICSRRFDMPRPLACIIALVVAVFSLDAFARDYDKTCVYMPRLVSDAASWDVDAQERSEIDSILGEALELCGDGKKEQAQELIETTNNERIMGWRMEGKKKSAGNEQN